MHTIQNDILSVEINPTGAELASIIKKSNKKEYMWQGDPQIWASQAPVLFPIIGGLKRGAYRYKDKEYSLPKHGFIRYNKNLKATKHSETKISFTLESSAKTKEVYPFDFVFEINFELVENQIFVSHIIENNGEESMYFSVGGHPAFNCPIHESASYSDYYIRLENGAGSPAYLLSEEGVITEQTISVFDEDKIHLHPQLFDKDALIFKNINAKKATLHHKNKGKVLSIRFWDFPDLGIWAKPKADFVCIEPWLGYADVVTSNQHLQDKEGIQLLSSGDVHRSSYTILIH